MTTLISDGNFLYADKRSTYMRLNHPMDRWFGPVAQTSREDDASKLYHYPGGKMHVDGRKVLALASAGHRRTSHAIIPLIEDSFDGSVREFQKAFNGAGHLRIDSSCHLVMIVEDATTVVFDVLASNKCEKARNHVPGLSIKIARYANGGKIGAGTGGSLALGLLPHEIVQKVPAEDLFIAGAYHDPSSSLLCDVFCTKQGRVFRNIQFKETRVEQAVRSIHALTQNYTGPKAVLKG